jgi:hypothetical protein
MPAQQKNQGKGRENEDQTTEQGQRKKSLSQHFT